MGIATNIGVRDAHTEMETIMNLVRAAAVGAPLLLAAMPAFAQSQSSPLGMDTSATAPDPERAILGNWGWLGLLGLIGLAGVKNARR